MDDQVQRGGVERSIDGKRLEQIGLDGGDVQLPEAPRDVTEDVRVRVEDRHRTAIGEAGSLEEVAGAGAHIQLPVADVLAVLSNST